jgi:hypothetical protein
MVSAFGSLGVETAANFLEEAEDESETSAMIRAGEAKQHGKESGRAGGDGLLVAEGFGDGEGDAIEQLGIDGAEHFGEDDGIAYGADGVFAVGAGGQVFEDFILGAEEAAHEAEGAGVVKLLKEVIAVEEGSGVFGRSLFEALEQLAFGVSGCEG